MQEDQLNISAIVNKQGSHIYVCGDVRMAEDIKNLLDKILLNDENGNQITSTTRTIQKASSDAVENHHNEYKCATDLLKVRDVLYA